jgi:hypothetical protein
MRVIESYFEFYVEGRIKVRVWHAEDALREEHEYEQDHRAFIAQVQNVVRTCEVVGVSAIANYVSAMAGVSAVQVNGKRGNGVCIYPRWP